MLGRASKIKLYMFFNAIHIDIHKGLMKVYSNNSKVHKHVSSVRSHNQGWGSLLTCDTTIKINSKIQVPK